EGYINLFSMQIIEGRDFYTNFIGDSTSCIVNEELVRMLNMDDPIGQTIYHFPGDTLKVIGIVKNFHAQSLHAAIPPVIILPNPQPNSRYIFIRVTPHADSTTVNHINRCWSAFSGNYPFEFQYLTDVFERQYQSDEQLIKLFRYFTFIAIVLSLLGLVGLAAFMIKQRTKEIALRKVFGASVISIGRYLSGKILVLILIANFIAWPVAYLLSRYILEIYVYRTAIQLWVFLFVGAISMVLTLLVIGFHTLRAASRNPSESLKYE
ncbi:ABC transporter permease, partial [Bacteroidota bacterium]